jgi:hypothetical protein
MPVGQTANTLLAEIRYIFHLSIGSNVFCRKLNISKRIKIPLVDVAINFYLMTDRSIASTY